MKVLTRITKQTACLGHMLGAARVMGPHQSDPVAPGAPKAAGEVRPEQERDFWLMINRLCGEVELLRQIDPEQPEWKKLTGELWDHIAELKVFFRVKSGISQMVSMLRTARFCYISRPSTPETLEKLHRCLQLIADGMNYTDSFADEIGDFLESELGVDLNAVDGLKKPEP